ncbi:uncharacterized protein LOC133778129 [Humulus lupulus]|uniref:uncharacterized protein LOC133778129 n=1 Tax=Humulus lupulus TaxID=3486 RepID=UPI002B402B44|nr:uncharacterized protein LOC133778129 [Humulus lupulus]
MASQTKTRAPSVKEKWGLCCVCLPKSLGGIRFKEGSKWNKVLLAKFFWVISSKQYILWVKWVDVIYLKGQNFWDYKINSDVSWYWRKLVNLKAIITRDELEKAVKKNKLNLRNLYVQMLNKERVQFANVVWCNLALPKHRFILWQATMGHLLTRDNLVHCHLNLESVMCPICDMQQENHGHLFLNCQFAQQVRSIVAVWLGSDVWPVKFEEWSSWMIGRPKGLKQKMAATALAASIYLIWWNRNNCLFNFCFMTVDRIDHLIKFYMKARIVRLPMAKMKGKDLAFF